MANKILVIAGSDSCGGAGIQADIKTATTLKTYCATAITCLTAQNSQKIYDIFYPPTSFLNKQIEVILDDIKIDIIKIGMLGSAEIISIVAEILERKAKHIPIIVDPVMISTSGNRLLEYEAIEALKTKLIANAYLVTPNILEAEILAGIKIATLKDIKIAARNIKNLGAKNILIKGGHNNFGKKILHYLLLTNNGEKIFSNKRLPFKSLHGTGCTLATAISCFLSHNLSLENSVNQANRFTCRAIKNSQEIGKGSRILKYC